MTTKTKKDEVQKVDPLMLKVFEHFCNEDVETSNELIHKFIVERSRDIHSKMVAEEESLREFALDTDMENDLAGDLKDLHGDEEHEGHEEGEEGVHDAEEELTSDMLDGEGGEGGEEHHDDLGGEEGGVADELASHEEHDEGQEEEVEDRLENLEDEFDHLKAIFAELAGDEEGVGGEEVTEGREMEPVKAVKKSGEVGSGSSGVSINGNDKSVLDKVDTKSVTLGGEPVEIGKGPNHKGYERETPPSHKDLIKGAVNTLKSSKEGLKAVPKVAKTGEIGASKSGMPIEGNVKSVIGS